MRLALHLADQLGRHIAGELLRQPMARTALGPVAQRQVQHQGRGDEQQRPGQRQQQMGPQVGGGVERQHHRQRCAAQKHGAQQAHPRQHGDEHGAQRQQEPDLIDERPGRAVAQAPVEGATDQVGMHLDAGIGLAHRRGAQIHQARRRKAQQGIAPAQARRRQLPGQDVGRRDVAKRAAVGAAGAAVGHLHGAARTHGQHQRLGRARQRQHAVAIGWRGGRRDAQRRRTQAAAQQRQAHGLVQRALEAGQQRHRAHHAIGVGHGVEEALRRRGRRQRRQVGAVAAPVQQLRPRRLAGQRRGQKAAAAALAVAGEVVAQHHRRPDDGPCERVVRGDPRRRRRALGLGKHHVQPQRGHLLALDQLAHQRGHARA